MKKQTIEVFIGVPASGKTTEKLKRLAADKKLVAVSRDDFRYMLRNEGFCEGKIEGMVTTLVDQAITESLAEGYSVLVDATHCNATSAKSYDKYQKRFPVDIKYTVFDITREEAIERDSKRERKVGAMVISRMYKALTEFKESEFFKTRVLGIKSEAEKIAFDRSLPKAVLVDLDGTLAIMGDRSPYDATNCDKDILNEPVRDMVKFYAENGYQIVFCSGREAKFEDPTRRFLEQHIGQPLGIPYELFMRKTSDSRKDNIVKMEILRDLIAPKYNPLIAIDDRLQVVKMWSDAGVFCVCVNQGLLDF